MFLPLYSSNGVSFVGRRHGQRKRKREEMSRWRRGDTSTGGWREMAAIFPTSSSREPIAFLQRALRRQLWLKNCLCHVRHIFLAFPLFSSLAPGVPGLLRLSLGPGPRPSPSLLPVTALSLSLSFSPLRLFLYHLRRVVVSHLLFSLFSQTKPPLHPSSTYSSSLPSLLLSFLPFFFLSPTSSFLFFFSPSFSLSLSFSLFLPFSILFFSFFF